MSVQTDPNEINGDLSESEFLGLSSAMVTALFHKPHDRQFIIDLENSVVSFIESNAESYELRPMNSYYRLLSHQVADYYNLKHALARTHDNYVIIFKGEGFRRVSGKPLLQELEPMVQASGSFESLHPPHGLKGSKKYRILKRTDGGQDGSMSPPTLESETSSMGPQSDFDGSKADLESQRVERERQYEQRKQEIFDTPHKEEFSLDKDDEGSSPQPCHFETSRYRFHNIDSSPPPQPRYNSRRKKNFNNGGHKDKRHYVDNNFNHKTYHNASGVPYDMSYMMYPTVPMGSGRGHHPLVPIMYPAPFPMDGNNGYIPPFMYQPMTNGMANPKGPVPAGYLAFPPLFPYGQQAPNYQSKLIDGPNNKYSQKSSIKLNPDSVSTSRTDTQAEKNLKGIHKGGPADNDCSRIELALDEATNGVENLSV